MEKTKKDVMYRRTFSMAWESRKTNPEFICKQSALGHLWNVIFNFYSGIQHLLLERIFWDFFKKISFSDTFVL